MVQGTGNTDFILRHRFLDKYMLYIRKYPLTRTSFQRLRNATALTWNHLLNAFSEVVLEKTLPNSSVSLYESNQSLRLIDPTQLCKVLSGFGLMISGNKEDYKVHFEMSFQIRKRGITPVNYPGGPKRQQYGNREKSQGKTGSWGFKWPFYAH